MNFDALRYIGAVPPEIGPFPDSLKAASQGRNCVRPRRLIAYYREPKLLHRANEIAPLFPACESLAGSNTVCAPEVARPRRQSGQTRPPTANMSACHKFSGCLAPGSLKSRSKRALGEPPGR
jgi:hypothetical protein